MIKLKNSKLILALAIIFGILFASYIVYFCFSYINAGDKFSANTTFASNNLAGLNAEAAKKTIDDNIGPGQISLVTPEVKIESDATSLGIESSQQQLLDAQKKDRLKSALMPFFYKNNLTNILQTNPITFKNTTQSNIPADLKPPLNSSYTLVNDNISIKPGQDGKNIDYSAVEQAILSQLSDGSMSITISTALVDASPAISEENLEFLKNESLIISKNEFTLSDGKNNYTLDKAELVSALITTPDATSLTINTASAQKIINEAAQKANVQKIDEVTTIYKSGKQSAITTAGANGKNVKNINVLADELIASINTLSSFNGAILFDEVAYEKKQVVLDDTIKLKNLSYSITTWGNTNTNLEDFANKVAQTLADGRGWAQSGVNFVKVGSGGDFEIVLSEPAELPARYPGICDDFYSCRVGRYVIINEARWQNATPVWTGTIRDYQHMVVNHEVGHRLGQGHPSCPATGQPAPVMLQQSINLQGCTFNPWPLNYEIAAVRRTL